jgi:hypothetical protein
MNFEIKNTFRSEVIVAGGGTAGLVASIASAREGAQVLLLEETGFLGGTASGGLVNSFLTFHDSEGNQVIRGIAEEIVDRLINMGGCSGHLPETRGDCYSCTMFDSELFKILAIQLIRENDISLLLRTRVIDTVVEKGKLKGLIIHNKSGLSLAEGKIFVDATGDADVVALGGGMYEIEKQDNLQPISLIFRLGNINTTELMKYIETHPKYFELSEETKNLNIKTWNCNSFRQLPAYKEAVEHGELPRGIVAQQGWFNTWENDSRSGEITINVTRVESIDGTDGESLTRGEMLAYEQILPLIDFFRKKIPGFKQSRLITIAPLIGVRETRRIIGKYILTKDDILNSRRFEDAIATVATPIDIHGGEKRKGEMLWIKTRKRGISSYDIPMRSLIPKGLDRVVVVGRSISATNEALGSIRMMPTCMATGQAGGTIAALATKTNQGISDLDINIVQNRLKHMNHFISR